MPTYEYACKSCGQSLEVVQKFTDAPLHECPNCGGTLRKVFGSVGISFKGSGFYKTDSRAASGAANKSSKPAEPSPGSDGSPKSGSESSDSSSKSSADSSGSKAAS